MNQTTSSLQMVRRPARGIALVITLLLLVLLSAFAVAFFTRMSVEQVSSASYADGVSSRQLAESAVGVVMSQIRDATVVPNGAWATQPGMVRVYAKGKLPNTTAASAPFAYYKLYSSNNMTVADDIKNFNPADEISVNWATQPALWTDLNEGAAVRYTDPTGKEQKVKRYPIIDPSLAVLTNTNSPDTLTYHNSRGQANGEAHIVEGFSIDKQKETTSPDESPLDASMPVRWLYVLRDGTLTAPDSSKDGGKTAEWTGGGSARSLPSKVNPIVGRVAFWADDDTSKVNINTSGGFTLLGTEKFRNNDPVMAKYKESTYAGSYWDTPRFATMFDYGGALDPAANKGKFLPGEGSLSLCQPPSSEFQRYPGHPFTTSLGLVFSSPNPTTPPRLTSEQLYRLLPRFASGGSKGGTDRLLTVSDDPSADSSVKLIAKNDRLYASVDEFFFAATQNNNVRQTANAFLKTDYKDPSGLTQYDVPGMTSDFIEKDQKTDTYRLDAYRFFLTAHSRAPELNLFGRPRISIWPQWAKGVTDSVTGKDHSEKRNASEKLIAFCSTLGPDPQGADSKHKEFYFQRYQPYDQSTDFAIKRNSELMKKYLCDSKTGVTTLTPPGFDKSFLSKYGTDRDQILTEIFDYIRVANLRDTTHYRELNPTLGTGVIDVSTPAKRALIEPYMYAPRGIVVPTRNTSLGTSGTKNIGFGRFPTVSEVALVFYHAGYVSTPKNGKSFVYFDPRKKNQNGVSENLIRAFLIVETYNPMQGYAGLTPFTTEENQRNIGVIHSLNFSSGPPHLTVQNQNGSSEKVSFGSLFATDNTIKFSSGSFYNGRNNAGMEGFQHTMGHPAYGNPGQWVTQIGSPTPESPALDPDYASLPAPPSLPAPADSPNYPFQWLNVIRVPGDLRPGKFNQKNFTFDNGSDGGAVEATLTVSFGSPVSGVLPLQTFKLSFPAETFPMPVDAYWYETGGLTWNVADNPLFNTGQPTYSGGPTSNGWGGLAFGKPEWAKSVGSRLYWMLGDAHLRGSSDSKAPYDTKTNTRINEGFAERGFSFTGRWRQILQPGDTIRSLVPAPADTTDIRSIALAQSSTTGTITSFAPLQPQYKSPVRHVQSPLPAGQTVPLQTQTLRAAAGSIYMSGTAMEPDDKVVNGQYLSAWKRVIYSPVFGNLVNIADKSHPYSSKAADLPPDVNGVTMAGKDVGKDVWGDFDTGQGDLPDGGYCNKADEGNLVYKHKYADSPNGPIYIYDHPYYSLNSSGYAEVFDTFFSPNRQLPSPVLFGSLLAGRGASEKPTNWRTLCFSPNPASLKATTPIGKADHPGFDIEPKDHVLLDLFTMPMVEPYAISEPFSTAGKVNLNCELMPFSYIRRTTALRAALQALRVTAVPPDTKRLPANISSDTTKYLFYKDYRYGPATPLGDYTIYAGQPQNYRYVLDRDETVKSIASVFSDTKDGLAGGFYRSASQICERFLYPKTDDGKDPKWSRNETDIRTFWGNNTLGGDNTREKPYADLYPRVTTKSNTFTVHMRVQKLRPQKGQKDSDFHVWKESDDAIAAEYRGESQIERYLDPHDRRFDLNDSSVTEPINVDTQSLEPAYRFRVIHSKRFAPTH